MALGILVGRRTANGYQPPLIHYLLKPRLSGNAINGWGETRPRRARPIYHWATIRFPHRRIWKLFVYRNLLHKTFRPEVREAVKLKQIGAVPVAAGVVEDSAENWSRRVKEFALAHEADLAGIARVDPRWIVEGTEVKERWIIVLGVAMNYERLETAPGEAAAHEVLVQYNRAQRAATALSNWIRGQGWHSIGYGGPFASPILAVPAAIATGLGELGKHGSIINRKYGASVRLAYVLTDLPLVADQPDFMGVDEFCTNCRLCTTECPPQAIFDTKQMVRGDLKWYVDFDKCVPFFNDTYGCAICLAVCPWSRPGLSESLAEKMLRKLGRQAAAARDSRGP